MAFKQLVLAVVLLGMAVLHARLGPSGQGSHILTSAYTLFIITVGYSSICDGDEPCAEC